ncbi:MULTISPECIES: hypothetical protein [Staphylococcus]|uniref:DUF5079 domain-containing protein n=1 Tax=Staphylococcus ureilyticus TaxID=94138 RepID=A0AB34AK10_STAUR|nr:MULTISPECIES: hypothetical protein [Staphylococcus]AVL76883.1 hypothetical protein CEQ12_03525 [Staphylococcus cohnii]MBL0376345.1 hypothetical protein [Staphylococcus sp. S75]MBL0382927.1 hypothetical protein [Staphylococcus sp. S59]MBL0401056.1 hypothetical protein [Staphylococcus sp. S36]MCT1915097.1 hypothetical protein [Staphylococcus ureilyticus]
MLSGLYDVLGFFIDLFMGKYSQFYLIVFILIIVLAAIIDLFISIGSKKSENKLLLFIKSLGIHFVGIIVFCGILLFINRMLTFIPFFHINSQSEELMGLTGITLYLSLLFVLFVGQFFMKMRGHKLFHVVIQFFIAIAIFYIGTLLLNFSVAFNIPIILADIAIVVLIGNVLLEYIEKVD